MAKRFTFRLETVLRLRRRTFEEAQRVVATRLRAVGREQAMVEATGVQVREQTAQRRSVQTARRLDVGAVRGHRAYVMFLHRRIGEGEQRIRQHEEKLESERAAMIQASVAVKALEKLKERRRARHLEEVKRQEAAEHNEIALQMHRRSVAMTSCAIVEG